MRRARAPLPGAHRRSARPPPLHRGADEDYDKLAPKGARRLRRFEDKDAAFVSTQEDPMMEARRGEGRGGRGELQGTVNAEAPRASLPPHRPLLPLQAFTEAEEGNVFATDAVLAHLM